MNRLTVNRRGLVAWVIAFLSFPVGGVLATLLVGHIDSPLEGAVGGVAAGLVIGIGQMLALRRRARIGLEWAAVTAAAMGLGVGISVALVGSETTLTAILLRAIVTGGLLGIGQALILRGFSRPFLWWIPAVIVLYPVAWFITAQVITSSVDMGFVLFGSSGALVYQILTGLVLLVLVAPREA